MPRHRSHATVRHGFLLLGLLGGCTPVPPTMSGSTSLPRAQAIAIEQRHVVRMNPTASALTSEEAAALGSFLRSLPDTPRPQIALGEPKGTARAVAGDRRASHAVAIVAAFIKQHLPQATIDRRPEQATPGFAGPRPNRPVAPQPVAPQPGALTNVAVEVTAHLVQVPACPDWSADPGYDPRNLPLPNLGCATATDLGLMLADPADLVAGSALGPADGAQAAEAVARYRAGKVTPLISESSLP